MKYAFVSVSAEGARLGRRVKSRLGTDITLYERTPVSPETEAVQFHRTADLTARIFGIYDGILYIMASGIAVRSIAPHLVSKASDPAVLVMDECGKHCISLVSGHLGGANAWTAEVARAAGADPVITTATDVHHRKAPDELARELYMKVEPLEALKPVNSLMAEGRKCLFFLDRELEGASFLEQRISASGVAAESLQHMENHDFDGAVLITEKKISCRKPHVYLRPRNLYVGIGCRRGTGEDLIEKALSEALAQIGACPGQIAALASVSLKSDEEGLLALGRKLKRPIHFFESDQLKEIIETHHLTESSFVKKTIGVGNVCEAAALKAAQNGRIVLPKTKYPQATAAIAAGRSQSSASDRGTERK
jgi:cobalt-precorrin 5A hydrolase